MMGCPDNVLAALWSEVEGRERFLDQVLLTGSEPVLPSSFAVGTIARATVAAVGLAAVELWHLRTGRMQRVSVDMRHAAAEFRSEKLFTLNGEVPRGFRDPLAGLYRCAGGGWARPHLTFPHHREGLLRLLGCDPSRTDKKALQDAFLCFDAVALEDRAAARGLPLAALRTFAEWDGHPQSAAVAALPLVAIEKIGEAPPRKLDSSGARPLDKVRVLELARIIAGPVCGRALAAHGADVLAVSAPHLPSVQQLVIDTGRGKLSCFLDLREVEQRARLRELIAGSDVFVQAYRPGALGRLGFDARDVADIKPGIVYAELSAWGWAGPWGERRGYDSLVQTATGFNHAEAEAAGDATPRELPSQALDHASGYLLALGIMRAMHRQATEGGSWRVRVCLARTGLWLRAMGRIPQGFESCAANEASYTEWFEEQASGFGIMKSVSHSARLSGTPAGWVRPSVPLGASDAAWPPG